MRENGDVFVSIEGGDVTRDESAAVKAAFAR